MKVEARPIEHLPRADVPCNGCTACCQRDVVFLHPEHGDVVGFYATELAIHPLTGQLKLALKRKPDKTCIYLGASGCTIHDRAPAVCRVFDCRRSFQRYSRTERKNLIREGLCTKEVFEAGRQRLHTLPENQRKLDVIDITTPKRRD